MDRDQTFSEYDGFAQTSESVSSRRGRLGSFGVRRGRPPGIDPTRLELLAAFSEQGLTLGEMAAVLEVSRQCIHAQLKKCAELPRTRKSKLKTRRDRNRSHRTHDRALRQLREAGAWSLLRFLESAAQRGWTLSLRPGCRPLVNGVPLAFHQPRQLHVKQKSGGTRYYHFQITRPEWFHVACLPDGRYAFYLPESNRRIGTYYIRSNAESQPWPSWTAGRSAGYVDIDLDRRAPVRPRDQRRAA